MAIDILTFAAARAGKGGGGSASKYKQPDWGSEFAEVEILPQTSFGADQLQDDSWPITSALPNSIQADKEYTINYNGKKYTCTAFKMDDDEGVPLICMGNGSHLGEEYASDAPFLFTELPKAAAEEYGIYALLTPLDGSTYATISIKAVDKVYHKIPAEYVSGGKLYVVKVSGSAPHTFDKPFDEIYKALSAGRAVYATDGSEYFPVAGWSGNKITFVLIYHINSDLVYRSYEYNSDGTTTYAFGTIGNSNT